MIKKLTVLLFSLAIISTSYSQWKNVKQEYKIIPDANNKIVTDAPNKPKFSPHTPGETFITTGYDYSCNNTTPIMVGLADIDGDGVLDPFFNAMKRETPTGQRKVMFGYKAFGFIDAFSAFDETATTSGSSTYGWGTMQYCAGGPLDGNALIMSHSNSQSMNSVIDLVNLTPVQPFPTTYYPGNFPSFVYMPDGTIIATNTDGYIWVSTDQGATFDSVSYVSDGDPNVFDFNTLAAADLPSEIPIYSSADGQTIAIVGSWDNAADVDTNAIVYWYGSTDGGGSWTGKIIGVGRGSHPVYGQIVNRDYAPYFNNFGQMNSIVSDDGVTHIVINGYGEGVLNGQTDTTNINGMSYWNSRDQQWMYISDPSTEGWDDGFGNSISTSTSRIYPGNGIGQAYGTLAASEDGQVIVAAWQSMEYTGTIGASAYNIYPGDGGSETGAVYYTDLRYAYSTDGGASWSPVATLKGDANVMETYPFFSRQLAVDPVSHKYVAHYVYYEDAVPGAAIFNGQVAGQNSWDANGAWKYDNLVLDVVVPSEVTNTIVFTADISGILGTGDGSAFDPAQDSLLVEGLIWDDFGKDVVGSRKMVSTGTPGIYTTTLTVTSGPACPNGEGDSTQFKFKAYPDGRFVNNGWEVGDNRWVVYQADGNTVNLPTIVPNISVITGVDLVNSNIPTVYDLGQNYPNPFNPSTKIRFSIPEAGLVTLKVFNSLGQEVAALFNGEVTAGNYESTFDASSVASGIYFYILNTKNYTSTKKMILLK